MLYLFAFFTTYHFLLIYLANVLQFFFSLIHISHLSLPCRFANKRFQKLTEDKRHLAPSMVDYLKRELRSSENVKNKEDSGGSLSDKLCSTGVLNLEIRFGSDKVSPLHHRGNLLRFLLSDSY